MPEFGLLVVNHKFVGQCERHFGCSGALVITSRCWAIGEVAPVRWSAETPSHFSTNL